MNIHLLREAQAAFVNQIDNTIGLREPLHVIRRNFVRYFTPSRILGMGVQEYALGYPRDNNRFNFCYGLERQLDGLGRILGASASKFGIYYSKNEERLMVAKKWGNGADPVFIKIKQSIVGLLEAGRRNDLAAIESNSLSRMFKGKILATYLPDQFLNVFSKEHLDYFLVQLNLDSEELSKAGAFYKKQALIDFKNQDLVMRDWSLDLFSYFLYHYYPGRPPYESRQENDPLAEYRRPDFPANPIPVIVRMDICPPVQSGPGRGLHHGTANTDYEAEARKNKLYGDRGEKIVLDMEKKRLEDAGLKRLSKNVRKAEFDYEGYDILSFEMNGTKKYIEVKATTVNVGKANFFLTANELEKATELGNYHVYIVFEILKRQPKVWMMGNPFNPENANVIKKPVKYRISVNARIV